MPNKHLVGKAGSLAEPRIRITGTPAKEQGKITDSVALNILKG
jgi:hypothetical protein